MHHVYNVTIIINIQILCLIKFASNQYSFLENRKMERKTKKCVFRQKKKIYMFGVNIYVFKLVNLKKEKMRQKLVKPFFGSLCVPSTLQLEFIAGCKRFWSVWGLYTTKQQILQVNEYSDKKDIETNPNCILKFESIIYDLWPDQINLTHWNDQPSHSQSVG